MTIKKYIIIFVLVIFVFSATNAKAEDQQKIKERTIDIIKHEIAVLQMLLKNIILSNNSSYTINAKSYVALDITNNTVLLENNADQQQSIASITKLMNAVVASENTTASSSLTITNQMLDAEGNSPSLYPGLSISFENLLRASLIQSVNDAAQSLSYFVGKDQFLDLMNKKARDLNMKNTVFVDVTGLSKDNKSTAKDLATLVSYVYYNHPDLLKITQKNDLWLPDQHGRLLKFYNVNNFYYVSEFLGGKTGYLPEARQNIASVFNIHEKPVAIITLNSDNRQADTLAIVNMLEKQ